MDTAFVADASTAHAALAARPSLAPEPLRAPALAAASALGESGTGGPGASMVPTCGQYSTPPLSSLLSHPQLTGMPSGAAYPTHGPLPSMPGLARQQLPAHDAQYPTPGVAYDPYATPLHMAHSICGNAAARDARDETIMQLTSQLNAALVELRSKDMASRASPPLPAMSNLHVPQMAHFDHMMPHRPSSPEGSVASLASFATITSSSKPPEDGIHGGWRTPSAPSTTGSSVGAADDLLPLPAAARLSTSGTVVARNEIFKSKELESVACDCDPETVAAWDVTMMGRLESKCAAAHRVLLYTDAEVRAMSPQARAVLHGYDIVLAGHMLAMLQAKTKRVKLVRATIASREKKKPGTITSSGRAIRAIIMEIINPTCGSELENLENELEKPFFNMGMDDVSVKLSAHRLEQLRAQLPPTARGGQRELLRALIKKFPTELAKDAAEYKKDMCKAEVRKRPYEWSYEELTAILSSHITASSSAIAETNSTERGGNGGGIGSSSFAGCLSCGLDGHISKKCNSPPCSYCGMRICFGARKRGPMVGCLVKKLVDGGKLDKSDVGLNGKPLFGHLLDKVKEKAEEMKAAKKGDAEVNAASQTDKTIDDDDDDDGAYESELCELDVCC